MTSSSFFSTCRVCLAKFSCWSKFHINTGSGVMTISIYKGLTRNPEIGNTTVWVFPNFWRLKQVRDTKSNTNVANEMLVDAAKCQGYSFYCFWVMRKTKRGELKITPTQIRINVKCLLSYRQIIIKLLLCSTLHIKFNMFF